MVTPTIKLLSGDNTFSDLQQRAHLDLAARARSGTLVYLAIWLPSAIWAGVFEISPLLFIANTLMLVVIALMRDVHYRLLQANPANNTRRMYQGLVGILLFNAFYWGSFAGWIIASDQYTELYYPYMVVLAALGIGGPTVLSISKVVSVAFPLLTFGPTLLLLLVKGGAEDMIMATLALFALLYVLNSSRLTRKDYWSAITSQKVAEDQARVMEELSITDQLTQIRNRMYFENRFSEEWSRCGRLRVPIAIFLLDLDHFKRINDTYGHAAGDACLVEVAGVLRGAMQRSMDTVARYGGEEFVVMISVTDKQALSVLAEKLVRAVAAMEVTWRGVPLRITCSVGLAVTIPSHNVNREKLLLAADKALYQAKAAGRNRYCVFDECADQCADSAPQELNLRNASRHNAITEAGTESGLTFA
jgi:diguanylate cyclase (GGDEF)-like protein